MADKIAMDRDVKIEQSWPRPDGAEGDICTSVFMVVTLNQDFGCAICGERIPAGLPMFMTRSPGLGTDYLQAMCPKHVRAMGRVLAADYDRLNPAPYMPSSVDDVSDSDELLIKCPKCGASKWTSTYRTYATSTDELELDATGSIVEVTARFPRMPDQDPGDLASIQCEECMAVVWSNPYL